MEIQRKIGVAIFLSDKIDFKPKPVKGDKEGHYIITKRSVYQKDTTINI